MVYNGAVVRGTSAALICAAATAVAGCYSGARVSRDLNRAWEGRSRASLEAKWGRPGEVKADGNDTILIWWYEWTRIDRLPSGDASVTIRPGELEAFARFSPGEVSRHRTYLVARVDAAGRVTGVRGPSIRWGAPDGLNLRWGFLLGMHAGLGRLDDTSTPLPSGGLYIGGMLSPTVGLVGTYSMVSGSDDAGGAMAFAWGLAPQWWVAERLWLRAGPAMVLAFDPGFEDAGLEPGISTGASYAVIRKGSFVLDLRLDLTAGTSTVFGSAGIGVNIN